MQILQVGQDIDPLSSLGHFQSQRQLGQPPVKGRQRCPTFYQLG
jgi:hypothetical protein